VENKPIDLIDFLQNQILAIEALWEANLQIPTLMLIYATLDTIGFIRTGGSEGEARPRFLDFVDHYIVKHLRGITNNDLWGARCAILHTVIPESSSSTNLQAKEILYSWGTASTELLNQVLADAPEPHKFVAMSVEDLMVALGNGMDEFLTDLEKDSDVYKVCTERVGKFYTHVPVQRK
jgi:hypothetical protein